MHLLHFLFFIEDLEITKELRNLQLRPFSDGFFVLLYLVRRNTVFICYTIIDFQKF
jgi:hypothetical protein